MIEEFSFLGFPLCSREVRKIATILHKQMASKVLVKIPVRQVESGSLSC